MVRRTAALGRAGIGVLALWACGDPSTGEGGAVDPGPAPVATPWYQDVTQESGVDFVHHNGAGGEKHLLEMNGGGVAMLDQDGDGDLELLFPQSMPLKGCDPAGKDWRDRMYRQEAPWRYADITEEMDCDDGAFSLSASVPDFDGDGDPDILYSNFGANRLLRNDGVRFVDVTGGSGIAGERWSSVATWADLDRDGDLDCYVGNYLVYDLEDFQPCGKLDRGPEYRAYCHPLEYEGEQDCLYENLGDGTFRDVTVAAGMEESRGRVLGLTTMDVDQNGLLELFVANDSSPNFLWHNQGGLRFVDRAVEWAVDAGGNGLAEACMGVDLADVDGDGDFDMVVTNFVMETNTLYRRDGQWFTDRSFPSGLGDPSLPLLAFGARFGDLDNDGDEDLALANGHIMDNVELYHPTLRFAQPPQLFTNDGTGRFTLVEPAEAGPYFGTRQVGRALASFDPDGDGDLDLVYVNNNSRPALLRNERGGNGAWIGVELRGPPGNPTAVGARLVVQAGARRWHRVQRSATSYIACSDPRLHVGLGPVDAVDSLTVTWPDGTETVVGSPAPGRYHVVEHGR